MKGPFIINILTRRGKNRRERPEFPGMKNPGEIKNILNFPNCRSVYFIRKMNNTKIMVVTRIRIFGIEGKY